MRTGYTAGNMGDFHMGAKGMRILTNDVFIGGYIRSVNTEFRRVCSSTHYIERDIWT